MYDISINCMIFSLGFSVFLFVPDARNFINKYTLNIYIYIYMCVCVCVYLSVSLSIYMFVC